MIKYVYALDYPPGQRHAYLEWVRAIAPVLQAPDEVKRLTAYENYFSASPHRIVEWEFEDLGASASYFARPEIKKVLNDLLDRGANIHVSVLQQRGDYTKS